jgi:hypothetical protein
MRTTLDLPEKLLNDAMRAINAKSKTQTIVTALENILKNERRKKIIDFHGKVDLNIDLDVLRNRS